MNRILDQPAETSVAKSRLWAQFGPMLLLSDILRLSASLVSSDHAVAFMSVVNAIMSLHFRQKRGAAMRVIAIFAALAVVLLTACDDGVEVTKNDYGDKWPFKPDEGTVKCLPDGSVIFVADGVQYGLNGFAKSRGYPGPEPIWLYDMAFHEEIAKGVAEAEQVTLDQAYKMLGPPQTRINIGPILERGLSLC